MTTAVLTVKECAALLRVSERHVRTLVRRGALPAVVADPVRIPRAAIDRLVAAADWQPVPAQAAPQPVTQPRGGRPLEIRDLVAQRDAARRERRHAR